MGLSTRQDGHLFKERCEDNPGNAHHRIPTPSRNRRGPLEN
jgi:hypothetical protein